MAHFHMKMKIPKGKSCLAKLSYISGTDKYENKSDVIEVQHFNIDFEPTDFWSAAENHERKNCGTKFREFEMMLPRELSHEQHLELMQNFINHEDVGLTNHPMSIGFHEGDDGNQPHAHLMLSERENDGIERENPADFFKRFNSKKPELGGCKKLSQKFRGSERCVEIKAAFAEVQNDFFKKLGLDISVSHLSFKDQGLDKIPQKSYGYKVGEMMKKSVDVSDSKIVQYNQWVKNKNLENQITYKKQETLSRDPVALDNLIFRLLELRNLENKTFKRPEKQKEITFKQVMSSNMRKEETGLIAYRQTKQLLSVQHEIAQEQTWFNPVAKIKAMMNYNKTFDEFKPIKKNWFSNKKDLQQKVSDTNKNRGIKYERQMKQYHQKREDLKLEIQDMKKEIASDFGSLEKAELAARQRHADLAPQRAAAAELQRQRNAELAAQQRLARQREQLREALIEKRNELNSSNDMSM